MLEPVIICPSCHAEIKLTESLAAPLVEATRGEFEKKLRDKESEVARREAVLRQERQEITVAKEQIEKSIAERVQAERQAIAVQESKKARLLISDELSAKSHELENLQVIIAAKDEKLAEAQKAQAETIRKQRELDDALLALDLTVEQRVQASLGSIRDKARRDVEAELNLKVAEREETIASLQRQIDLLKQKAEQGSQQLQGEVQELELEALLAQNFPMDIVEPVPKGEFGGDILQQVLNSSGHTCGTILWESKRTKHWSDTWLAKLRGDQRSAKAEMSVLVSRALPKGVDSFSLIEDVWVVDPHCVYPVATALRQSLIEIANARMANEGRHTKMELVYDYLTGPRFRGHVQTIVEKFSAMEEDLASERRTMNRIWAKREGQIRGAIEATAGFYGDLEGIAGRSLKEIEGLEFPMLSAATQE